MRPPRSIVSADGRALAEAMGRSAGSLLIEEFFEGSSRVFEMRSSSRRSAHVQ
jgi:hypothetical protein